MKFSNSSGYDAAELPRELRGFKDYHRGETILVCGCGSSLSRIIAPERTITIGVNDVGRLFDPDYLVVVNPRTQFSAGRFSYVENSRANAIFTQLDLGIRHPHVVRFKLGRRGGAEFANPDVLPFTRNSPYPAVCLAIHMGARRIGILGVDFTPNHFFAPSGRHTLSCELHQIDREYKQLNEAAGRMGVEIFNLSQESTLTAFPKMALEEFLEPAPAAFRGRKVFFVNYKFLSCGDVFSDGLARAADRMGLEWKAALWDKPDIEKEIREFAPELLFAVHGRKFSARCGAAINNLKKDLKSAVWLLDEPYEVDDTSRFSRRFGAAFLNDPATLDRHHNAHYLPACYDPGAHFYSPADVRTHEVGFIGGFNAAREEALVHLAKRNLLSYAVGGPWRDKMLLRLCLSKNIPASETARLYRHTRIVINVFRKTHHYNASKIAAVSLNPRIYEALQCGALVLSEHRPEVDTLCPELPTFRTLEEMEMQVERFLADPELYARVRKACIRRLAAHTYGERLQTVLETTLGESRERSVEAAAKAEPRRIEIHGGRMSVSTAVNDAVPVAGTDEGLPLEVLIDWERHGRAVTVQPDGSLLFSNAQEESPGSELGLVTHSKRDDSILEFEVLLNQESRFIAKIHLAEAHDQCSNSYHLMCSGGQAYLARHHHVLARLTLPLGVWVSLSLSCCEGSVVLRRSGAEVARVTDRTLSSGYCFLGAKRGTTRVRRVSVRVPLGREILRPIPRVRVNGGNGSQETPVVSIITTVYDRVQCLEQCLRSVKALEFRDYEHIVVADAPPPAIREQIRRVIAACGLGPKQPVFACLEQRRNNWGIAPAARGLEMARGRYICFLSDDNGYKPNHFNKLVPMLETNPSLGFVYSSCAYDGRMTLRSPLPAPGRIDLGQPLFRRELFDKYLGGTLPFTEYGWDWRMIERLMRNGVRWQHVNEDTFLFRLARYPQFQHRVEPPGISYCIACYRPRYARMLIADLIAKTTTPFEILVWLNIADGDFERFLEERKDAGADIRVVGRTPKNIGMSVYPQLFAAAKFEMITQIDDDVVSVSPGISEAALDVFYRFPNVGMLTADVWQDEYTTGARPPMHCYRTISEEFGLHDGPIDGWFAVYRKSALEHCGHIRPTKYFCLGCAIKGHLNSIGRQALLCTRMKVFHVTDPVYVSYFGMLDSEIEKYRAIGRSDQVDRYTAARESLPAKEDLDDRVQRILAHLKSAPAEMPVSASA